VYVNKTGKDVNINTSQQQQQQHQHFTTTTSTTTQQHFTTTTTYMVTITSWVSCESVQCEQDPNP
jgi:hypothetical protein